MARWRAVFYVAAIATRTLLALAASAFLAAPILSAAIAQDMSTDRVGLLVIAGLALMGAGLPVISAALALTDWDSASALKGGVLQVRPTIRLREPKTLVRPLAYSIVMLTFGGTIAAIGSLLAIGSLVALFSPFLAMTGDVAVIGPFVVTTLPHSLIAASVGALVLFAAVRASPYIASAHLRLVQQVLTQPEDHLRHDLVVTTRSRARLVRSFDLERRRIERDLHDGVQPQLLSVSMTLGLALAAFPEGTPGRDDVVRAQKQARRTLDDLRRVVRNIHPQVLVDHGLGPAIREIADNLTIAVSVDDRLDPRLPADAESNLYFCVSELLSNVVKHSDATRTDILLHRPTPGHVHICVRDDGSGGAGIRRREDGGLNGIADRLAALNGTLTIDSPSGGPTVVTIDVVLTEAGTQ